MNVLHLSTTGGRGGAGNAAHRIHRALLASGVKSRMSVRVHFEDEWHVRTHSRKTSRVATTLKNRIKAEWNRVFLRPSAPFSTQFMPGDGAAFLRGVDEGIVNLHWICDGFLGIGAIGRIQVPIVWTIHDQWPFTGGCHYSGECEKFTESCGSCPILQGGSEFDRSRRVFSAKQRRWKDLRIAVVSPSHWMAKKAASSTIFRDRKIHVIPNPLDLDTFRPIPKKQARHRLGLDTSKPTLLFGAVSATTDPRKGFDLFEKTLNLLGSQLEGVQLVVFGASAPSSPQTKRHHMRFLGQLHDDAEIALAYSAADVFVAPSREDNFPNTVVESLACGTPVAAFRVGGIPEMVKHEHNGFLAQPFDTHQLAHGISSLLADPRSPELAAHARSSAEVLFAPQVVAAKYRDLYQTMISIDRNRCRD
jgi:glycosyltransferase involved in cell wall biosynthesis